MTRCRLAFKMPKSTPCTWSLTLSLILFAIFSTFASATCYWQNSTLAPDSPYSIAQDDTACFPSQDNSPCCGTGWSCLSDGVCAITENGQEYYYRGTCTDRTWNSQECPGWCFAENSNTSIPLAKCQTSTGEDWYCCPGDPDCNCQTGKDALKLGASQPVTVTVIGSTTWPGYQSTATPIGAGNIAGAGTSTAQGSGSMTATATTTTSPSTAADSTSTSSSTSTPQSTHGTALAAGPGAGIGIAAALGLAGALYFFLRSRKRRSTTTTTTTAALLNNNDPQTFHRQDPYGYSPDNNGSNNSEMQSQPLMAPHSAKGYYSPATDGAVAEKDGSEAWSLRQELPAYSNGNVKGENGKNVSSAEAAEMDASTSAGSDGGTAVPGRVELA